MYSSDTSVGQNLHSGQNLVFPLFISLLLYKISQLSLSLSHRLTEDVERLRSTLEKTERERAAELSDLTARQAQLSARCEGLEREKEKKEERNTELVCGTFPSPLCGGLCRKIELKIIYSSSPAPLAMTVHTDGAIDQSVGREWCPWQPARGGGPATASTVGHQIT